MESRKIVFRETAFVAVGEVICTAAMIGIYALLGYYDLSVLLGGIAGMLITVGNFFFMAVVAILASDKAMAGDVEGGKKMVKASRTLRFFAMGGLLVVCAVSKVFDVLALVLPLLFTRPILLLAEFFRKKEG